LDVLAALVEGGQADDGAILSVAGALVQVDDNLSSLSHGGRGEMEKITGDAQRAVAAEARVGLERVKQSLVDYVSSQWDVRHLPEVPGELTAITGALSMIPLVHAAELIRRCGDYVGAELMAGHVPTWQEMDRLADAISGIDYYLERLASENPGGAEEVLALVQRSLEGLNTPSALPLEPESFVVRPQPAVAEPLAEGKKAEGEKAEGEKAEADKAEAEKAEAERAEAERAEAERAEAEKAEAEKAEAEKAEAEEAEAAKGDTREPAMRLGEAEVAIAAEPADRADESDTHQADRIGAPGHRDGGQGAERDLDPAFDLSNALFDGMALALERSEPDARASTPAAGEPSADRIAKLVDDFGCDAEVLEIFLDEIDEVVAALDAHTDAWAAALDDEHHQAEIRRAFHTLKGSGRMVGANVLGEMAWSVENMMNRVVDATVVPTPEFVAVLRDARLLIPALRSAFEQQTAPAMEGVGRVMEQADMLASGGALTELEEQQGQEENATAEVDAGADEALFVAEALSYLETLAAACRDGSFMLNDEVVRALHTLTGSAAVAGVAVIGELAAPAYELVLALRRSGVDTLLDGEPAEYLGQVTAALTAMVEDLKSGRQPEEQFQLIAEADRLLVGAGDRTGPAPLIALPSLNELMKVTEFLDAWRDGAMDLAFADDLRGALADVRAVAQAQGQHTVAELAGVLLDAHERYEFAVLDAHAHGVLTQAHEQLLRHIDAIAADQAPRAIPELQAAIDELAPRHEPDEDLVSFDVGTDPSLRDDDDAELEHFAFELEAEPGDVALEPEPAVEPERAARPEPAATRFAGDFLPDDVDPELIGVFFEEADELLEVLEQSINDWSGAPANLLPLENLLRALHTLKGGARLSGLSRLGDLTHDLESFLIEFQDKAQAAEPSLFRSLHERYDDLAVSLARSKQQYRGSKAAIAQDRDAPAASGEEAAAGTDSPVDLDRHDARPQARDEEPAITAEASLAADAADQGAGCEVKPDGESLRADNIARLPSAAPDVASPDPGKPARNADARADQEMVRVGAGLLESLVNLAGESSIIRARVEQSMSDFAGSLDEMERTIHRLREQLRRLEIETEGQVLFRRDRGDGPAYENFDPLEMDRYSQLQQLSRSLSESASDLLDLKETLLNKSREAETLLLQQARVNTELQEGLMRSRMVPFSRLLPRLRRTVRQVSKELDKHVELRAFNLEGELDRSLLERMLPPLEHMLRNAVDHGIETPDQRRAQGKADGGHIDLRLSREGGDLVIEISDDGAGIDVERVRAKAVERGLLAPDADLGDDEISQFVLAPGFSTARSVTQISGRGVGMDVVHSEVKQLGGNIDIFTQRGKGTRFLLRVPFTVSVNRALMVSVGEDLYAVPLNTIEGIVLLSPDELERVYAPNGHTFEYAGVPYRVQYLGNFLGRAYRPQRSPVSVPVVLVRSGEQAVAVHVDAVQGSREIVVKSLGPQFAGVGGISGATILGDGSVVVILDLLALIRAQSGSGIAAAKRKLAGAKAVRRVMVVDDSVTVRKVTSRLLERQGMDVVVAKDGVEAMAMLQERRPDVMLLDIEMPRMDGFEVLRQIRHDERLHHLPVVMISSRTGAKHQQHATELGVNGFLGKPFQESELLAIIDELMN
jgi:chemosensory pili system protein ChpA (sensor histidine kinase/response regulator)